MTRDVHEGAELFLRASAETSDDQNRPNPRALEKREYVMLRSKEYHNPNNYRDPYLSNHRLQIIPLSEVSVPEMRRWKNSDDYEIQEINGKELWERLIGDMTSEDWVKRDE